MSRFHDDSDSGLIAPSFIPMDCLLLVFSFLRGKTLGNLRRVCKEFEIAFNNTKLAYPYLNSLKNYRKMNTSKDGLGHIGVTSGMLDCGGSETFDFLKTKEKSVSLNKSFDQTQKDFYHQILSKITKTSSSRREKIEKGEKKPIIMRDMIIEFGEFCTLRFLYDNDRNLKEFQSGILLTLPSSKIREFYFDHYSLLHSMKNKKVIRMDLVDESYVQIGGRMEEIFSDSRGIKMRLVLEKEKDRVEDEHDWCMEDEMGLRQEKKRD